MQSSEIKTFTQNEAKEKVENVFSAYAKGYENNSFTRFYYCNLFGDVSMIMTAQAARKKVDKIGGYAFETVANRGVLRVVFI